MENRRIALLAIIALAVGTTSLFVFGKGKNVTPINDEAKAMYRTAQKLVPLHETLGRPQAGDWLLSHSERGQTFGQYTRGRPVQLSPERKTLYVLPLGEFDETQMKIVELSAEFLGHYFMCDVRTMETQGLDNIPQKAKRVHPNWGMRQLHSKYVLDEFLTPQLPDDAVALIAFSSMDLYPEESWNFVFGQASLRNRVGVWSLFRNGDSKTEFTRVLTRTLKTATHETGHMFSIRHCTAYECNMCGSNGLEESDRHPIYLCPECVCKVWWSTKCDPLERFRKLKKFCGENDLLDDAEFYENSIKTITSKK